MKENQKGQSVQNNPGGQQKQFDQNKNKESQNQQDQTKGQQKNPQNDLEIEQPNREEREKNPMKKPYMEQQDQEEEDENVGGGNDVRNQQGAQYRKTDAQWNSESERDQQRGTASEDFNDTRKQTQRDEEEGNITNEDEQNDITNKGGKNEPMR